MNNVEKLSYFLLGTQWMFQVFASYLMIKKSGRTRAQQLFLWSQLYWVVIVTKDFWFLSGEEIPYQWAIILDLAAVPVSSFFVLEQFFPTKINHRFCLKASLPFLILLSISVIASAFTPYRLHNTITDFWEYASYDLQNKLVVIAGIYSLTYAIFWLIKILKQQHKYRRHLSENYSYTENINLEWVTSVVYILLGLLAFYTTIYFSNLNSQYSDSMYYTCLLITWMYVYTRMDKQEQLNVTPHYWETEEEEEEDTNKITAIGNNDLSISTADKSIHQGNNKMEQQIYYAFDAKQLHLNSKLTIVDLAAACNTDRTHLSNFINKELGISFYDFVNRYRIQHVSIPMIEKDGSIYSIEEIALASGFGSISTFKRAFKKITNMPPGTYMERNSEDE